MWLLIPMLAGVAFWLWAGPEPRYGWQTMWALAAVSVALASHRFDAAWQPRIVVLALVLTIPGIAYRAGVAALLRHGNPIAEIPFLPPGSDHGFHPKPVETFKLIRTRHGSAIYVPEHDDHPLTWDGPIPCTAWPPLDMNVRLRKPDDLSSGFVTDPS
jgi:hypothetical protein